MARVSLGCSERQGLSGSLTACGISRDVFREIFHHLLSSFSSLPGPFWMLGAGDIDPFPRMLGDALSPLREASFSIRVIASGMS